MINNNKTSVVTDERGFYKVKVKPFATSIGIISFTHGIFEEAINGSTIAATQSPVTGHTSATVSANVTDLKAGTNYHYRIVAANDKGTIYGEDVTFTSEYVTGE